MKNIVALRKELEGTLVGRIIACMEAGEFRYPFDVAKEGDISLGDMTLYEKACATIIAESLGNNDELKMHHGGSFDARHLVNDHKQVESLLWSSITNRLATTRFFRPGIIDGFKIVDQGKRTCPKCIGCPSSSQCPGSMTDDDCGWP